MAQLSGHNVVNQSESPSGSPLVDVTANPNTTESALSGPTDTTFPTSTSITDKPSETPSESPARELTAGFATDPSAGNVVSSAGGNLSRANTPNGDLPNGAHDDAFHEGIADDRSTAALSLNSDTDHSRADSADKKDESNHNRTNSVKRPPIFSKITATKNFLAKSVSPVPSATKPGEKSSSTTLSATLTAKPRLVAKSAGTSLRDIAKARAEGSGGPDASKVWNKNRPVPPPAPRHFTDEELKQQYGIHLATRLQADESGKEAKWADIDDDEEDWVPEQVVWMDGTKSTLTPQQETPRPIVEEKPSTPQVAKPNDAPKPTLANMKKDSTSTRTILKPGAAIATNQAKQKETPDAPARGPEKTLLKAKSPAPAPVKSPWAPVPKVESVSPINPPVQQPSAPPILAPQDARAYDPPAQTTSLPPRELAVDSYSRGWREGEGAPGELFNSSNGRYEPVQDRRNTLRPDERKPNVLQRPGGAPPEPSAAFQTRTTSQTEGLWPRRRGSSVSQGSNSFNRRMSMSKGSEFSDSHEQRPHNLGNNFQAHQANNQDGAKPQFHQQTAWQQQMPTQMEQVAEPTEDPVIAQERIMREKRESARQRKKEDEDREEAAKQERLKAKLAALAGAGKSKKERDAEAAAAAAVAAAAESSASPVTTNTVANVGEAVSESKAHLHDDKQTVQTGKIAGSSTSTVTANDRSSRLLDSAKTQPQSVPDALDDNFPTPSPIPTKYEASDAADKTVSDQSQRPVVRSHLSPRTATRAPYQQQQQSSPYKASPSAFSSPGDRKQQLAFGRQPNTDANSTWMSVPPGGSVWGTSLGIGNGTFDGFKALSMSQQGSALPPPPGMNRASAPSTRISPQAFGSESQSPNLSQQQKPDQPWSYQSSAEQSNDGFVGQSRLNGAMSNANRPVHPPGPIGPPARSQQQQQPGRPQGIAAWQSAADRSLASSTGDLQDSMDKLHLGAHNPTPTFSHTFKKTAPEQGPLGAPRKYEKSEHSMIDIHGARSVSSQSPLPQVSQEKHMQGMPSTYNTWNPAVQSNVRLPEPSQHLSHVNMPQQPAIGPPSVHHIPTASHHLVAQASSANVPKDASPPPPELSSHQINSGDASRPLVKLPPPPPPQPRVRLPPAPVVSPYAPMHMAPHSGSVIMPGLQRPAGAFVPPGVPRPLVQHQDWHARINGLFNRAHVQTETPPSPPGTPPKPQGPALAIAASSRAPMDQHSWPANVSATVSLPSKRRVTAEGFVLDESDAVQSKPSSAQILAEEPKFGSSPHVRVPVGYRARPRSTVYQNMLRLDSAHWRHTAADLQTLKIFTFFKPLEGVYLRIPGTRLRNKLAHYAGVEAHKKRNVPPNRHDKHVADGAAPSERKSSGKFNKTRNAKDSPVAASATGTSTPASNAPAGSAATKTAPSSSDGASSAKAVGVSEKRKASGWKKSENRKSSTPVKAA